MGCNSTTSYGDCIGLDDEKDPKLNYSVSVWNLIGAVVFVETIIVPIYVCLENIQCPVSRK